MKKREASAIIYNIINSGIISEELEDNLREVVNHIEDEDFEEDCSEEDREICICSKCAYQMHGCCKECEGPITGCEDFGKDNL